MCELEGCCRCDSLLKGLGGMEGRMGLTGNTTADVQPEDQTHKSDIFNVVTESPLVRA